MKKTDPIVQEVELLHANPTYAYVRLPDGRDTTASLRDLAPCPRGTIDAQKSIFKYPDEVAYNPTMSNEAEENTDSDDDEDDERPVSSTPS